MASPIPPQVIRTIAWLGNGALLPFVLLAIASVVDKEQQDFWGQALYTYAAVTLAFVGALHWGFAMAIPDIPPTRRNAVLIWSVVPALLAWGALMLDGPETGIVLVLGFVAHYRQDMRLHQEGYLPPWYLPLRLQLTAVACVCLGLTSYLLS